MQQVMCSKAYEPLPRGRHLWGHARQHTVVEAVPAGVAEGQPAPQAVDATQLLDHDLAHVLLRHPWVGTKLLLPGQLKTRGMEGMTLPEYGTSMVAMIQGVLQDMECPCGNKCPINCTHPLLKPGGGGGAGGWDDWECLPYSEAKVQAKLGMHFMRGVSKVKSKKGHPSYLVMDFGKHHQEYAHRVLLWALDGPPPRVAPEHGWVGQHKRPKMGPLQQVPMEALHLCNNKMCLNPAHLAWGTHLESMDHLDGPSDRRATLMAQGAKGIEFKPG